MKRLTISLTACALLGLSDAALAQTGTMGGKMHAPHGASLSASDRTFVTKAAEGGLGEVALGRLAAQRGASPGVKQFGQRMVRDHSKADQQLAQVAAKKHVTLPKSPGQDVQTTMAKLARLSGAAFDRAYIKDMVEDHSKDVAEFRKESGTGRDPDVRKFAAATLPVIEHHLQMAQALRSAGGRSTGMSGHHMSGHRATGKM